MEIQSKAEISPTRGRGGALDWSPLQEDTEQAVLPEKPMVL